MEFKFFFLLFITGKQSTSYLGCSNSHGQQTQIGTLECSKVGRPEKIISTTDLDWRFKKQHHPHPSSHWGCLDFSCSQNIVTCVCHLCLKLIHMKNFTARKTGTGVCAKLVYIYFVCTFVVRKYLNVLNWGSMAWYYNKTTPGDIEGPAQDLVSVV